MKIIVASDSFKGSLSSADVNAAIEAGLCGVFPDAEILAVAVGDGGEGTCRALVDAMHGEECECIVEGPLGAPVAARYGIVSGDTAIIEISEASGLTLVKEVRRDAMLASTFGTGMMIQDAIRRGCCKFIVGIGGSATTDGGTGMLAALGVRFYDNRGMLLKPCGAQLQRVSRIEASALKAYKGLQFTVAADVDNPLYGPRGAACVFAPQKGASPQQVAKLDEGLRNLARVAEKTLEKDYSQIPGAGAAGGLGFALAAFLGGKICRGADIVLDAWDFDKQLRNADLVITGEGRLDRQTLMGKMPISILERARKMNVPVIAIGGSVVDREKLERGGFAALVEVDAGDASLEEAMRPEVAKDNIRKTIARFFASQQHGL